MRFGLNIRGKLIALFLIVGLIPLLAVGVYSLVTSSSALSDQAYNQLVSVREMKKRQIESFFEQRRDDMAMLLQTVAAMQQEGFAKLEAVGHLKKKQIESFFRQRLALMADVQKNLRFTEGVVAFGEAFKNGLDSQDYKAVYQSRYPGLKMFLDIFGFYDIFLIDTQGNVVFTVAKEPDFGQNLLTGKLKDSGLAKAFHQARDGVALIDYSWYEPSKSYAAFIAVPLHDPAGNFAGVAAFQLSPQKTNAIVQPRIGLGETGETYLVGLADGKTSYRSDRLIKKGKIGEPKSDEAIKLALAGKSGRRIKRSSTGELEPEIYTPLDIKGLKWAMVTTASLEEVIAPRLHGHKKDYFTDYIEKYDYYDLFLISPEGDIFYTVSKEADYRTNIVNGKFADTGLGRLVRRVIKTRQYGVADFEPYAPSNNEPAAFIAQPLIHNGEIELVVALQLSLAAINKVMQQKEGMGKTGGSYLVGPDKLLRSDTDLDHTPRLLKKSFAQKLTMNSPTVDKALAGQSGIEDIEMIVEGEPQLILSAYAPIKVGDTTWAMMVEIDDAEALAAAYHLKWAMGMAAGICVVAIVILAWLIARSFTRPIVAALDMAQSIEKGDLAVDDLAHNRSDELGLMAAALNSMKNQLRDIVQTIQNTADSIAKSTEEIASGSQDLSERTQEEASALEETAASLEEMTSSVKQNAENSAVAKNLAEATTASAAEGNQVVKEAIDAMALVTESSSKINDIIDVVNEIAFQTNLLALNASVEAARAGEAGRGFAVVAGEVRNLAGRSAEAAKEIQALIQDATSKVEDGNKMVSLAGEKLQDIIEKVEQVTDTVAEISSSSKEQATAIDEINRAVGQMDESVQQNAALVEESAAATADLASQAEGLNQLMTRFRIDRAAGMVRASQASPPKALPTSKEPPAPPAEPAETVKTAANVVGPQEGDEFFDDDLEGFEKF